MPVYINGVQQDTGDGQWYGRSSAPGGFGGTYMGPSPFANAGTSQANPYLSSSSASAGGGGAAGGIPTGTVPHPDSIARVGAPAIGNFQYSQAATDYPTWMRNLGENNAQEAFQTATNQGVQAGNSVQGYQAALNARNNARLSYMAQAGQQQNAVEKNQAEQQNTFNSALNQQFGINTTQRGQDVGMADSLYSGDVAQRGQGLQYLVGMANAESRSQGGGISMGGGTNLPRSGGGGASTRNNYIGMSGQTGLAGSSGPGWGMSPSSYSSDGTAAGLGYDPMNPNIYGGNIDYGLGFGMPQGYGDPAFPQSAL